MTNISLQSRMFNGKRENTHRVPTGAKVATAVALVLAILGLNMADDKRTKRQLDEYINSTSPTNITLQAGNTFENTALRLLGREYFDRADKGILARAFLEENGLPSNYDFRNLQAGQEYAFRTTQ